MKLKLTEGQTASLRAFLERFEDAERLSDREYVVDLYDVESPVSLDLVFVRGGVAVDGAAELKYSEEEDGWYMGDRLDDLDAVDVLHSRIVQGFGFDHGVLVARLAAPHHQRAGIGLLPDQYGCRGRNHGLGAPGGKLAGGLDRGRRTQESGQGATSHPRIRRGGGQCQ